MATRTPTRSNICSPDRAQEDEELNRQPHGHEMPRRPLDNEDVRLTQRPLEPKDDKLPQDPEEDEQNRRPHSLADPQP